MMAFGKAAWRKPESEGSEMSELIELAGATVVSLQPDRQSRVVIYGDDVRALCDALRRPPGPNARLVAAARRHKYIVR
jgi:hypothetical protein